VVTNEAGAFFFPSVRPDVYAVRISLAGFQTFERSPVVIHASDKYAAGVFTLQLGRLTENLVVDGRKVALQAHSGERSFSLENAATKHIAVNGRSVFGLIGLVPGVVPISPVAEPPTQSSHFSVNGQRSNSNNVTIDGITNIDTGDNGANMATTNLDAVAELKVLSSSYQAEYGRALGAQVQVITKSGTQSFAGSGYWFGRRSEWNANTWSNNLSGIPKAGGSRDDFGYTIGGPLFIPGRFNREKTRLFFFFNQEFQRRRDSAVEARVTVPTMLERLGDFSASVDRDGAPAPYIRDYSTGLPCAPTDTRGCFQAGGVIGRIPSDRLYQPSLAVLSLYPLPNATGNKGFNYRSQEPPEQPRREELLRLDYQASGSWRFAGRFMQNSDSRMLPYGVSWAVGSNVPTLRGRQEMPGRNIMVSALGILDGTTSLEVTVGSAHNSLDIYTTNIELTRTAAGMSRLPMLFHDAVQQDMLPRFRFQGVGSGASGTTAGGAAEFFTAAGPFANQNTTHDAMVTLARVISSHGLKAGFYFQRSHKTQSSFAPFNGLIDFQNDLNNPYDTGHAYANAATGVFHTFQQASEYAKPTWRYSNVEWFVQDNWRVSRKLTLDYGVRFYYATPQWDVSLQSSNFLPAAFDPARAVRLFQPAVVDGRRIGIDPATGRSVHEAFIGRVVPDSGDRFNGTFAAGDGIDQTLSAGGRFNLAPRVGLAYDLGTAQSAIVRGAFGISYDRPQGNTVFDLIRNPPSVQEEQLTWGRFQDVAISRPLNAPLSLTATEYGWELPRTYNWNAGLQFKLPLALTGDVAYVGSESRKLAQQRNVNAVPYGAAFLPQNQDPTREPSAIPGAAALPADFLRPYQGYSTIRLWEFEGHSNYHALQTSLNRRFDKGFMLGANYTWSKALGTGNDDFAAARSDGRDREANYAPLSIDRPHNVVVSFVYQIPSVSRPILSALANNWQVSGVYRWMSGAPYGVNFSIPGITAANLTGSDQGARVALTGDPGRGWSNDPYRQLNASAFAPPQPGSVGLESARTFLHGPPTNNLDLSLSKTLSVDQRRRVEIRVDAFNALNWTQFSTVNNTVNFRSLTDPTITNLPYDASGNLINQNGFGTISGVRPARQLQLVARLSF
jgi:hypothetical protein